MQLFRHIIVDFDSKLELELELEEEEEEKETNTFFAQIFCFLLLFFFCFNTFSIYADQYPESRLNILRLITNKKKVLN